MSEQSSMSEESTQSEESHSDSEESTLSEESSSDNENDGWVQAESGCEFCCKAGTDMVEHHYVAVEMYRSYCILCDYHYNTCVPNVEELSVYGRWPRTTRFMCRRRYGYHTHERHSDEEIEE